MVSLESVSFHLLISWTLPQPGNRYRERSDHIWHGKAEPNAPKGFRSLNHVLLSAVNVYMGEWMGRQTHGPFLVPSL